MPWPGHSARYAMPEVYEAIKQHKTTLLFVNTRSQAELLFQELWRINEDNLPIALHHGSLDVGQRRRVEAAMASNSAARRRRDLDARSRHRLGRCRSRRPCRRAEGREPAGAAHRPLQPPHGRAVAAILVPANRFEVLECHAALEANYRRRAGHAAAASPARSTCWRSMCWACACAAPFDADDLYRRGAHRRALCRARPRDLRPRRRFRRHRRLCAEDLRALRHASARPRTASGASPSARRPAVPPECRHHRRGAGAERALCRAAGKGVGARAAGRCSARSRSISSRR